MVQRWLEPTASKKINAITIVDSVHMTDWVCDLVLKLSFFSLLASVESLLAITMYSSCMVQTIETSVFRDWHIRSYLVTLFYVVPLHWNISFL